MLLQSLLFAAGTLPLLGQCKDYSNLSPVYKDNVEAIANVSNIIYLEWDQLKKALSEPASANKSSIGGFDWTKPFPGESIEGHSMHLTVAHDVPVPEDMVEDATSSVTSLTFSVPDSLTGDDDQSLAEMDPSWYICRHIYISTKAEARESVSNGKGCDFLPKQCQDDIRGNLTQKWGKVDSDFMCGSSIFESLPRSCTDSFGSARADVLAFNSTDLKDKELSKVIGFNTQVKDDWRIGTEYHDPGDPKAYELASNRTYLVATVWGYGRQVEKSKIKTPEVSLNCLSPWTEPEVPPGNATTTTQGTSTASATPTSTKQLDGRDSSRFGAIHLPGV